MDSKRQQTDEMVFCTRNGEWTSVTFRIGKRFFIPTRIDVDACAFRNDNGCDLACLSPVRGLSAPVEAGGPGRNQSNGQESIPPATRDDAAGSSIDRLITSDPYSILSLIR
jgi:hypothetical protein